MKTMRRTHTLLALLAVVMALSVALAVPVRAQAQTGAEETVVYAVLLWSPQCPHCHNFIENDYPKMVEAFGDRFQLIFVNVTTEDGQALAQAAYDAYGIPLDQRFVPMMFIGEHVLVGGYEIPVRGSEIIREALAADGIPLPPIPGLQEAYEQALAQSQASSAPAAPDTSDTLGARFSRDPLGNGLAVLVLIGLVVSLVAVVRAGVKVLSTRSKRKPRCLTAPTCRVAALLAALVGVGIALTLIMQAGGGLAMVMSVLAGLLLTAAALGLIITREQELPGWLVPVAALAGLAAAVYLAYVEVGQQAAVCGMVGDCNTVQQSPYAMLFGVLPIGVLGIGGYVAILAAWALGRVKDDRTHDAAQAGLLVMALFGVAFSTYLTFLEPFVIGATCAWCLTSALVMLLLLWLIAPSGWAAVQRLRQA